MSCLETAATPWDDEWTQSVSDRQRALLDHIDAEKHRVLAPHLPKGGMVLEVGAGSGRFLERVAGHTRATAVALDYSRVAVEQLVPRVPRAVVGRSPELPFPGERFDAVLSGGLLEHFPDPLPILVDMRRVLRRAGLFYADIVPDKRSLYRIHEYLGEHHFHDDIPETNYSMAQWGAYMEEAGYVDVQVSCSLVLPPGWLALRTPAVFRLLEGLTRRLDGTSLAPPLGWTYFVLARRG